MSYAGKYSNAHESARGSASRRPRASSRLTVTRVAAHAGAPELGGGAAVCVRDDTYRHDVNRHVHRVVLTRTLDSRHRTATHTTRTRPRHDGSIESLIIDIVPKNTKLYKTLREK